MRICPIQIPQERLKSFCERNRIRRLALFGSVLRDDFTDASDVDVLVEFAPEAHVGLIRLGGIEAELSELMGRHVDLNMADSLSKYFRDEVLSESEVIYDAANDLIRIQCT